MLALLKLILCKVSFAYAMLELHTKSTCNASFAYAMLASHTKSIHSMHAMCEVKYKLIFIYTIYNFYALLVLVRLMVTSKST